MPRTLPSEYLTARQQLAAAGAAWLDLFIVELAPGQVARLVNNPVHVTCDSLVYQACNAQLPGLEEVGDGSNASFTLRMSNASGLPLAAVEQDQVLGRPVTCAIVLESELDGGFIDDLTWVFTATACAARRSTIAFELGRAASLQRVPADSFRRSVFPQLPRARLQR